MNSNKQFSEELKNSCSETWNKILHHRFILEIQQDILSIDKFIFYLKQDQIFLNEFCNLLETGARIANTTKEIEWFENLINSTTRFEIKMQNDILDSLGTKAISFPASPDNTTLNYISFMKNVQGTNDIGILISAMAPCPWIYFAIANRLKDIAIRTPGYRKWIQFYSSEESQKQVYEIRELLNSLSLHMDDEKKAILKKHFSTACNYELEFWNMAYSHVD